MLIIAAEWIHRFPWMSVEPLACAAAPPTPHPPPPPSPFLLLLSCFPSLSFSFSMRIRREERDGEGERGSSCQRARHFPMPHARRFANRGRRRQRRCGSATHHRARIVWKVEGSLEEQESKTLAVRSSRPTHPWRPGVIDTRAGRCSSRPPRPQQQKKKPTKAALSSKKKPRQRSAVNHITPQPAARRGKSKNCGGLHFQVGKGTGGMTTSETGRATGRAKNAAAAHRARP